MLHGVQCGHIGALSLQDQKMTDQIRSKAGKPENAGPNRRAEQGRTWKMTDLDTQTYIVSNNDIVWMKVTSRVTLSRRLSEH